VTRTRDRRVAEAPRQTAAPTAPTESHGVPQVAATFVVVLVAVALDLAVIASARATGLADVDHLYSPVLIAGVGAAAFLARQVLGIFGDDADTTWRAGGVIVAVATAWLLLALARHVVDLTATWNGTPVTGPAHVAWDVGYHAPQLALATLGVLVLLRSRRAARR
jgi:hypothetical protein